MGGWLYLIGYSEVNIISEISVCQSQYMHEVVVSSLPHVDHVHRSTNTSIQYGIEHFIEVLRDIVLQAKEIERVLDELFVHLAIYMITT